jgi:hypothetical protein
LGCDRFSDGLARWAPQSKHNQELGGGDSLIFELAGGAFVYPIPLYGELEAKLLNE